MRLEEQRLREALRAFYKMGFNDSNAHFAVAEEWNKHEGRVETPAQEERDDA